MVGKAKKVPFEKRPICSCGVKMKLAKYIGYYDELMYWTCDNCDLEKQLDKYAPDNEYRGAYA
ncbi:hypothetical protein D3C81_606470 [compost metagenome]